MKARRKVTEREYIAEQLYNAWSDWHERQRHSSGARTIPAPPWDEADAKWREAFELLATRAMELAKGG